MGCVYSYLKPPKTEKNIDAKCNAEFILKLVNLVKRLNVFTDLAIAEERCMMRETYEEALKCTLMLELLDEFYSQDIDLYRQDRRKIPKADIKKDMTDLGQNLIQFLKDVTKYKHNLKNLVADQIELNEAVSLLYKQ